MSVLLFAYRVVSLPHLGKQNENCCTGKKYEDICPSTHNMDVPHVKREDYQLTDISDDGYLCLMADNGDLREDLKIPDGEVGAQLRAEYDAGKDILCTVLKSCGEEVSAATNCVHLATRIKSCESDISWVQLEFQ